MGALARHQRESLRFDGVLAKYAAAFPKNARFFSYSATCLRKRSTSARSAPRGGSKSVPFAAAILDSVVNFLRRPGMTTPSLTDPKAGGWMCLLSRGNLRELERIWGCHEGESTWTSSVGVSCSHADGVSGSRVDAVE